MSHTCGECKDLEGTAWRRWAAQQLGDAPTVRDATDQDLRRCLTEQRRAAAVRVANLEHTIKVMVEAEQASGPAPDLSCEAARHDFQGADVACGPGCKVAAPALTAAQRAPRFLLLQLLLRRWRRAGAGFARRQGSNA